MIDADVEYGKARNSYKSVQEKKLMEEKVNQEKLVAEEIEKDSTTEARVETTDQATTTPESSDTSMSTPSEELEAQDKTDIENEEIPQENESAESTEATATSSDPE